MLNRIAQGSSYRAIDEFVDSFTQLAMQRPLDNDVQLICQNQDSNHMLSTLTDTLPGQLAGAMELSVSRAMQPVAQSMDNFLIGATRAQVDGVGRIVTNFVGQMNASLNQQFLELGRTLTDMNQNQQGALEKVTQSLATAHAMLEDVNRLQGVSQDVMAHFEGYVRELGENRRRDERFEQSSAELLERMRQSAEAQAAALQKMKGYQDELTRALSQFQQQSYDSMTGMRKLSEDTAARLSGVGKTMQDSGRELKESYQSFVQNVVEGLSRSLGMFDQSMNSLITALGEKIDSAAALGTDGATAEQMSEIQRLLSSMQETLRQAAESLGGKKEA